MIYTVHLPYLPCLGDAYCMRVRESRNVRARRRGISIAAVYAVYTYGLYAQPKKGYRTALIGRAFKLPPSRTRTGWRSVGCDDLPTSDGPAGVVNEEADLEEVVQRHARRQLFGDEIARQTKCREQKPLSDGCGGLHTGGRCERLPTRLYHEQRAC